jgi:hypothetical protein
VGDLVRVLGHPQMEFIPQDAADFGQALIEAAKAAGWDDPEEDDGR